MWSSGCRGVRGPDLEKLLRPRKRAQRVRLGPPTMSPYVIERIRRERAGKSLAAIANGLNADRIPTIQGGRRWYPASQNAGTTTPRHVWHRGSNSSLPPKWTNGMGYPTI